MVINVSGQKNKNHTSDVSNLGFRSDSSITVVFNYHNIIRKHCCSIFFMDIPFPIK